MHTTFFALQKLGTPADTLTFREAAHAFFMASSPINANVACTGLQITVYVRC